MTEGQAANDRRQHVLARLASFALLSEREREMLSQIAGDHRQVPRKSVIRSAEGRNDTLHLLIDGWAASAISLADGSRQLVTINLTGDMLGLPALAVAEPLDTVIALSDAIVCEIKVGGIADLFANCPRLATILFLVSQEERIHAMERIALIGQAPARARLAALLVRLSEKVDLIGLESPRAFAFPLTQQEIGDLIGISAVHTNVVIQELREAGLITLEKRELRILDPAALLTTAQIAPWRRSNPQWLPDPDSEA